MRRAIAILLALNCSKTAVAQTANSNYQLALPAHQGQLQWSIDGYRIVENSAKPNGNEIGVRGRDIAGQIVFLGFLFTVPESAPATSAKCRDGALKLEMKSNPALRLLRTLEIDRPGDLPVALAAYTKPTRDGSLSYSIRGFVAAGDICGDLEFYSTKPINETDPALKQAFLGYHLDTSYSPQFGDLIMYAQVLYLHHDYAAAGPLFEKSVAIIPADGRPFKSAAMARRLALDQAGLSYGISGELAKARSVFQRGIAEDPEYPMYYYNLACADAGEKKLSDAKLHLQQAFERKANLNPGETMPIPTEDDSFLPYKKNADFWKFLQSLSAGK
jgi:tetratricopeptide (TPR) repeat protein